MINSKLEIFKKGGKDNLYIISDFDATLTYAWNDDLTQASNSISVFRQNGFLSKEYVKAANDLANFYRPIELNEELSYEEKSKYMVEWWSKHFDLLVKSGLNYSLIKEVADKDLLHLREGFEDFTQIIFKNKIPLFVFSAGVGDLIKLYFEKKEIDFSNIHIVSNLWNYDKRGNFLGIESKIIHSLNKNQSMIISTPFYTQIKHRKNIILLGDSLGDLSMVKGLDCDNILTIGFFNKKKTDSDYTVAREKYLISYDLVIENDSGLEKVIEILNKIIN